MLRLTLGPLGLAALRGAAGESAFDYKLKGHQGGGLCAGASRSEESQLDLSHCRDRCSKDKGCKFLVFGEGEWPSCLLYESCDKQQPDSRNYTVFQKVERSTSNVKTTTVTTTTADPNAIMLDKPIRNKDQPKDKQLNDLLASMAKSGKKKPEKEVMDLVKGMCPGAVNIDGDGPVHLINTVWNLGDDHAGSVRVEPMDAKKGKNGAVVPYMSGRTYFAESCKTGEYNHNEYVAMNLLGKTFSYTVDLTDAGCGCNAALYLTNLRQNSNVSECQDYYCDANNVCGVSCAEVDIMEANQHAWHSTLHSATDRDGAAVGYGGGGPGWSGPRDWAQKEYGPKGKCVDTEQPFQVSVSFPVDSKGVLKAMDIKLEQPKKPCAMELSLNKYEGMKQMTEAFEAGMTPIISYWAADDMVWMDGAGDDMQGPCIKDSAKKCGEKVSMYDFAVTSLKMGYKSPVVHKPTTTTPPLAVQKEIKKELAKELAAQQKEQAKEDAEKGITGDQKDDWEQGGNEWDNQDDWDQQGQQQQDQQQGDWDQEGQQQGDWNQQGQQQGDWNQQGQQQGDWSQEGQKKDQQKGDDKKKKKEDESWGQPWASWDHSTPPPGQTWDGVGRPVEDDAQTSTTTTPCEVDADPIRCRPKLPGDPTRGGLKDKNADVDYLFKKNAALGPILRSAGPSGGTAAAALVAGAAVLAAAVASLLAARRRRSAASPSASALVASEVPPPRAVGPLRPAPSSQSLLTLSAEAV